VLAATAYVFNGRWLNITNAIADALIDSVCMSTQGWRRSCQWLMNPDATAMPDLQSEREDAGPFGHEACPRWRRDTLRAAWPRGEFVSRATNAALMPTGARAVSRSSNGTFESGNAVAAMQALQAAA